MNSAIIIKTEGITKRFGDFIAVNQVDIEVRKDETLGIIGPNGAGKTTLLNLLTGLYIPDEGRVFHEGREITKDAPERRVAAGILRTFQLVRVFDNLSVYEHMGLAYYRKERNSSLPLHMFVSNLGRREILKKVDESLEMFELAQLSGERVGNLSLGNKRRLEIAMAFIANPVVLALDEPFAGLGDLEIDEVIRVFQKYSHQKTILIVEHKISKLLDIVDRLAVMHEGKIIASGPPKETLEEPEVRRVYWKVLSAKGSQENWPDGQVTIPGVSKVRVKMGNVQNETLLQVRDLDVSYKKLKVLFQVSMEIHSGEVIVVVGRNGAGKTTLFKTITGFVKKEAGSLLYKGSEIGRLKPYEVAMAGVKYIPQDKIVFTDLKVRENLELGSYATGDYDWDEVLQYFPKLKALLDRKAGHLSGGERQMLLIARALLGKPDLVLMDEPTEGLAPHVITDLAHAFKEISKKTTLGIIEQNLPLAGEIANRVYCMKEGKIINETTDRQEIKDLVFEACL